MQQIITNHALYLLIRTKVMSCRKITFECIVKKIERLLLAARNLGTLNVQIIVRTQVRDEPDGTFSRDLMEHADIQVGAVVEKNNHVYNLEGNDHMHNLAGK